MADVIHWFSHVGWVTLFKTNFKFSPKNICEALTLKNFEIKIHKLKTLLNPPNIIEIQFRLSLRCLACGDRKD